MSSSAAEVNLKTWSDADYAQAFCWRTGTDPDIFYDFTGMGMMLTVRHHATDIEALLSLTTEEEDIVLSKDGESLSIINIYITRDKLLLLPVGTHDQSLIMVRPDGLHTDLWRGTLTHAIGPTR